VIAAADSLFLLGERDVVYDVDYQMLLGERKSANGFVHSQIDELRDPKVVAMALVLFLKIGEPIEPNEDSARRWHPGPLADLE
jgi:hypothetical protein